MSENAGGWTHSVAAYPTPCRSCRKVYDVALAPGERSRDWTCKACLSRIAVAPVRAKATRQKAKRVLRKSHAKDASAVRPASLKSRFDRLSMFELTELLLTELDRTDCSAEVVAFLTNAMASHEGWSPKTGSDPLTVLGSDLDRPTLKAVRKTLGRLKADLKLVPAFKSRYSKGEGWLPSDSAAEVTQRVTKEPGRRKGSLKAGRSGTVVGLPTFVVGKPGMGLWNTKKSKGRKVFRCPDCRKPLRDFNERIDLPSAVRVLPLALMKGDLARSREGFCTAHVNPDPQSTPVEVMKAVEAYDAARQGARTLQVETDVDVTGEAKITPIKIRPGNVRILPHQPPVDFAIARLCGRMPKSGRLKCDRRLPVALTIMTFTAIPILAATEDREADAFERNLVRAKDEGWHGALRFKRSIPPVSQPLAFVVPQ